MATQTQVPTAKTGTGRDNSVRSVSVDSVTGGSWTDLEAPARAMAVDVVVEDAERRPRRDRVGD